MGAKDEITPVRRKESRVLSVINEDSTDDDLHREDSISLENGDIPKKARTRKIATLGPTEADLILLKHTANKLNLNTRRPSVLAWKAKYVDTPRIVNDTTRNSTKTTEVDKFSSARHDRINDSLKWIRSQLTEMRKMDQSLASQFLGIRRELNQLKLQKSCEEHEDMLDGATSNMEDFQSLSKFLDEPLGSYAPSPLKHVGITKMNLSSRRFSTC
ncbi:hypothetical protein SNE40_011720 [Patella caerulea]|uniref:Uncharacterized protein n=1 Tax=Patella caerulea TaxID=87958 RepID=A0AAN8JSS5_PATCE